MVEASHKLQRGATMTDLHDFAKRYQKHMKAIAQANVLNKAVVFDALAAAGITRITTEFDGEGDSGQLSGITAYIEETGVTLPLVHITLHRSEIGADALITKSETLENAVITLCYDYLEQEYAGWENNDGAYGEFIFDVAARRIELEANLRFSDTTTYDHTF
jgi:hypothetical protein